MASPPRVPGVPPPLPWEREGEYDPSTNLRSGRDAPFLGRGTKFGVWIAVNSTNVNRIKCDIDRDPAGNKLGTGTIYIEFLDLSLYAYPKRPLNDFLDLESSSSKGRYSYYEVRGPGKSTPGKSLWTFIKLRGPQRKVTQEMKDARKPRTEEQKKRYYNVGGKNKAGGGTPSPHG